MQCNIGHRHCPAWRIRAYMHVDGVKKYESSLISMNVCGRKLIWRLYQLVERDPRKRDMIKNADIFPCIPKWVNSLAPGKFERNLRYVIFQGNLVIDGRGISCEIALIWMSVDFTDEWWSVNIGTGNGLVLSGNKPLPEPMLTQISDAIRRH